MILIFIVSIMTVTPKLDVGEIQVGQGITIISSVSLGGRLLSVIDMSNQSVEHAEHLKKMFSGGHPVFFDLRVFSVVFLFDNCVCCAPFLLDRLASAGGPCRSYVAAAVADLVVECANLDKLVNVGSQHFGYLVASLPTSVVLLAVLVVHRLCPLELLVRRHKSDAGSDG